MPISDLSKLYLAVAAANGADFICCVTPAEHLAQSTIDDVREGVIVSKIAAHIGDLEKQIPSAWERDRKMSEARNRFDWKIMFEVFIDPEKTRRVRHSSEDKDRYVCSMCGNMCALKTHARDVGEEEK